MTKPPHTTPKAPQIKTKALHMITKVPRVMTKAPHTTSKALRIIGHFRNVRALGRVSYID